VERDVRISASENIEIETPDGERLLPSLAFWCCLTLSAALFALVFLAPRLRTLRDLGRQYDGLQSELVASERHVDYLHKVVDALRDDPDFASELARADFGGSGTQERIAVSAPLSLNAGPRSDQNFAPDVPRSLSQRVLDTTMLDSLSDDRSVRGSLLAAASLVVLVAFTLLCDSRPRLRKVDPAAWRARCRQWFVERYKDART
jgi:hypothetical protein